MQPQKLFFHGLQMPSPQLLAHNSTNAVHCSQRVDALSSRAQGTPTQTRCASNAYTRRRRGQHMAAVAATISKKYMECWSQRGGRHGVAALTPSDVTNAGGETGVCVPPPHTEGSSPTTEFITPALCPGITVRTSGAPLCPVSRTPN